MATQKHNNAAMMQTGSSMQWRGVIFDCDGVLINSRAANGQYYNNILAFFGLPPLSKEQEEYVHMATVHQSLAYILPPALQVRLPEALEAVDYHRDIMPLVQLEHGVRDFLDWLLERNIRCAVHTNRFNGMPVILEAFSLQSYFDPVVTAAIVAPKPAPDGVYHIMQQWDMPKEQLLFIGDSLMDAQTAHAAGVSFVAYNNPALTAQMHVTSFDALSKAMQTMPCGSGCSPAADLL